MDAIEALHSRVSIARLKSPAPSESQRQLIFKAALRAADHGCLRPWRYLIVEGDGLTRLGEVFLRAALLSEPDMSDAKKNKYLQMPNRAPLIVVAISVNAHHPKVPVLEQEMAVAAGVQNMITAAYAIGVGAYWRTGAMAESAQVKESLGVDGHETIVGFIYMGTPEISPRQAPNLAVNDFFKAW
jgi:nitroreductase